MIIIYFKFSFNYYIKLFDVKFDRSGTIWEVGERNRVELMKNMIMINKKSWNDELANKLWMIEFGSSKIFN